MTNLVTVPVTSSAIVGEWDKPQLEIIKEQIAVGCSDGELALFAQVCKKTGLDPFTRQIYAIKRGSKMTISVSIDGLRAQAARSGQYNGSESWWCGNDGVWVDCWLGKEPPAAAKVQVKRGIGAFVAVARYDSYSQVNNNIWKSMPDVMLSKCAEALALRKAFPEQLSGLYTGEEMQQADNPSSLPATSEESPYKQATIDLFKKLGWSAPQQKTWAARINIMPSSKWSDGDWQNAAELLLKELEGITVEAGND